MPDGSSEQLYSNHQFLRDVVFWMSGFQLLCAIAMR